MSADTRSGFDRRSALKKAAAAGTIAWTAPTILSETAHAVQILPGGCTAKCTPNPTIDVTPTTFLFCTRGGAKWARLTFSVAGIVCPCQTGGARATFLFGNAEPNPADVKLVSYDPATNEGEIIIGGMGQGALGNGSYEVALTFCVQCNDRKDPPDVISRECTTLVNFTFAPGDGECSADENVGAASLVGTACSDAECVACP